MRHYDLGILGGGQLARMSIQAGQRMGLKCLSLDELPDSPAGQIADSILGSLQSPEDIANLLTKCDFVTLENEFIKPHVLLEACALSNFEIDRLTPSPSTLGMINDKFVQRQKLSIAGVPSPQAMELSKDSLAQVVSEFSFPFVIKSRFMGYDGKGTLVVANQKELLESRNLWETGGWLAEEFVPFERELAVMVYRSNTQEGAFPTVETVQKNHVCDLVIPSDHDGSKIAIEAVKAMDGFGLFGVELFLEPSGRLSVNEIAPRPHNSGHYTLDWGGVSQFEQHVRLAMGWACSIPQGEPTCMANLFGQKQSGDFKSAIKAALEAVPESHVHWYGKSESRPGRKMGHINVVGAGSQEKVLKAREAFLSAWSKA